MVKNDLIQLVKKAKNANSVLFVLDSRLGTRRYNKHRRKDEFLNTKVLKTPLEILWDGTPSKGMIMSSFYGLRDVLGPRKLGAPLTQTTMLKLAQFNAFQLVMEIFSSNISPMVSAFNISQIKDTNDIHRLLIHLHKSPKRSKVIS